MISEAGAEVHNSLCTVNFWHIERCLIIEFRQDHIPAGTWIWPNEAHMSFESKGLGNICIILSYWVCSNL